MFPTDFWNHYGMPQTNNNIEAYNLKLKKCIGIAHPKINKSIDVPAPYRRKMI